MNKIHSALSAVLLLALLATSSAIAAPAATPTPTTDAAQRDTLGVSDVKILPALVGTAGAAGTIDSLNRLVQSLDSQLITALNATRKFQIVARNDLDAVMKEQALSRSGMVDDAAAARMYKLAGAKYVLVTTVNDFQDRVEKANFSALGQQAERRSVSLLCIASIYATDTGKLLESIKAQVTDGDVRGASQNIRESGSGWAEQLPVAIAGLAADKIARGVTDVLYPSKVVAKTGNQITLNRGEGTGVAVGQIWVVYHTGPEMFDPDTHESLGREEVPIGRARINTITPRTSVAELLDDRGVGLLDVARLTDAPAAAPASPAAQATRRSVSGPPPPPPAPAQP